MNAEDQINLVNALRGPVLLITIGLLFLAERFTNFGFAETWPIILIVVGLLHLAGSTRRLPNLGGPR